MTAFGTRDWAGANQAYLAASLRALHEIIARAGRGQEEGEPVERPPVDPAAALEHVAEQFALTVFERDILLLCAGIELDADFAHACRGAARGSRRRDAGPPGRSR